MKKIFFDIETSNTFLEAETDKPEGLDLAVLSIYSTAEEKFFSFEKHELERAEEFFKRADLLITFNGNHFDIPLLQKYFKLNLKYIKHVDLLEEVKKSLGRRIKLNSLAQATLNEEKSADGLESIAWFKEGKIDKVKAYCEKDVEITKKIYEYALLNNYLFFINKENQKEKINLETTDWEKVKNSLF